jgi:hypothetical protein
MDNGNLMGDLLRVPLFSNLEKSRQAPLNPSDVSGGDSMCPCMVVTSHNRVVW